MESLLIILCCIYCTVFVVGTTGNLIMVMVTFYCKNLRSICNILIGFCCFCDLLLFTDIIAFMISMFMPITQEFCYFMSIPADFGAFASSACVLAVGIDRLIAVALPARYKTLEHDRFWYLLILIAFPVVYALALLYIGFTQRDPGRIVVCLVPESLGHAYDVFALTSFVINLFVSPIYAYVYMKIKKMGLNSSMKAVFKSLTITVCLVLCGWMATDTVGALSLTLPIDKNVARMMQLYAGVFILSSSSFNAFVYYRISRDYRTAIRAMLRISNATSVSKGSGYRDTTDGARSSTHRRSTITVRTSMHM
ncbi:G-protein coupled receptors family 1 profile domain-containing protein [Caenorhabditis elegans]|uniref:G-protein coupled receptors family 1 profile domain-containing protein n=1 Tax=Caenorhabditis elegans TaxID=6239 RepID=O45832_CAEEL|nr:G-protein coupled receptors family 1 profile domain-containing protein [Caenorhabditis elegans]CAB03427.2 G-protein coupled receptors family 1 profile domain-containing protein [Caenorhabditis elegans]|eukprot:NP_506944.2 Serpentine Receptor, class SX [Caenorhabditis elegans]